MDFLRPQGRLNEAWLEDAYQALASLIDQAAALTTNERAQRAWVYAQAYDRIADDAMAKPATEAADDIRESYSDEQLQHWQRLARKHEREFQTLTGVGAGTSGVAPTRPVW